MSFKPG